MSKKETVINPNSINQVASSTVIEGELVTESDIKFDGKLTGKLVTKNKLVLGESGQIKGEIYCKSAIISGKIEGKIFVEEIITLQATAYIEGELSTDKLAIEPGAVLNGTCIMKNKITNNQKRTE
jgi:cytoskeletal protein CcmA (bactofilin family)